MVSKGKNRNEKTMDETLSSLAAGVEKMDMMFSLDRGTMLSKQHYQSCIKYQGRSILPPLITEDKAFMITLDRQKAMMVEARIHDQTKQKQHQKLLAKIEDVLNTVQSNRSKSAMATLQLQDQKDHSQDKSMDHQSDSGYSQRATASDEVKALVRKSYPPDSISTTESPRDPVYPITSTPIDGLDSGVDSFIEKVVDKELLYNDDDGSEIEEDDDDDEVVSYEEMNKVWMKLTGEQYHGDLIPRGEQRDENVRGQHNTEQRNIIDVILKNKVTYEEEEMASKGRNCVETVIKDRHSTPEGTEAATKTTEETVTKQDQKNAHHQYHESSKPVRSDVITNVLGNSVTNSSALSDASEDMDSTVVVKTNNDHKEEGVTNVDTKEERVTSVPVASKNSPTAVDQAQDFISTPLDEHTAVDLNVTPEFDPSSTLLSRVNFSDDTPVASPVKHRSKWTQGEELVDLRRSISISPGPMSPPDLSEINSVNSEMEDDGDEEEEEEATLQTGVYMDTASTSLGKYMVTCSERNASEYTTLPHRQEFVHEEDDHPALKTDRTESDVSSLHTMEDILTPRSVDNKDSAAVQAVHEKSNVFGNPNGTLNKSYTLEHPSPMLQASEAKKSRHNSTKSESPGQQRARIASSTSIEDLRLNSSNSKAQRRLDYGNETSTTPHVLTDIETHGKREHLEKYLDSYSQMPKDDIKHIENKENIANQSNMSASADQLALEKLQQQRLEMLRKQHAEEMARLMAEHARNTALFQEEIRREKERKLMVSQSSHASGSDNTVTPTSSPTKKPTTVPLSPTTTGKPVPLPSTEPTLLTYSTKPTVPPSPAEKQRNRYTQWLRAPKPEPNHDVSHNTTISHNSTVSHFESGGEMTPRPVSAPAHHKVGFYGNNHHDHLRGGHNHNRSGVIVEDPCENMSIIDHQQHNVHTPPPLKDPYATPKVLRERSTHISPAGGVSAIDPRLKSLSHSNSPVSSKHSSSKHSSPSTPPVSILKHHSPHVTPPTKENGLQHNEQTHSNKSNKKAQDILVKQQIQVPDANNQPAVVPANMHKKFCSVSAAVRGYLTRRLLRTDRVQFIINTIRDTLACAVSFQSESPVKRGHLTPADRDLQSRLFNQLEAAVYNLHEICFDYSITEQMHIIHQDRLNIQEKQFRSMALSQQSAAEVKKVSAATRKALERKRKAQIAEERVFGDSSRCVSAPPGGGGSSTKQNKKPTEDQRQRGAIARQYQFLMNRVTSTANKRKSHPPSDASSRPTTADSSAPSTARSVLSNKSAASGVNRQVAKKAPAKTSAKTTAKATDKTTHVPVKKSTPTTTTVARKVAKAATNKARTETNT